MLKPIMNVADVSLDPIPPEFAPTGPAAERFEARTGVIGVRIGARKLGYNITAVSPGKRAWPFHNHPVKEEMFFVLQGSGEVRIGEARYPIRSGDIVACPAGGTETAHQIINTGPEELRYLAVSTEHSLRDSAVSGFRQVCSEGRVRNCAGRDAATIRFRRSGD